MLNLFLMRWKFLFFTFLVVSFFSGLFIRNGGISFKTKKVSFPQLTQNEDFLAFCKEAAASPDVFKYFKRNPIYNLFYENLSYEDGKKILKGIKEKMPELLESDLLERIRKMDCLGGPHIYDFGSIGPFSATTLHYLKFAGDLKKAFGPMNELRIIEIGVGCGGLCKVLHEVFDIEHYAIIDLPESLELARKHLSALGLHHIRYFTPDEIKLEPSDLLISYQGFTESSAPLQKRYIRKLFASAARGYLLCHFFPKHFNLRSMQKKELLQSIQTRQKEVMIHPEEQSGIDEKNYVLTWGQ